MTDVEHQDTQDTASLTGGRFFLLLTLLCALLFLPGLMSIPPTDRDESRFMQASKQMIESGDFVHINFQDEPRNKKPIGIYWLQAASVKMFGQALNVAWPYRVPSVIAAWLAVLATGYAGRRLFNPAAGLAAGVILATSFIVVVEAHIAKTDAALLAATTIAMTMLARIYTDPEVTWPPVLAFWAALGVGILLKGPVILLVAVAAILTLCIADRDFQGLTSLKPLAGIPLLLIIVLPWVLLISGGGGENTPQGNFFADAVLNDLLPKLIGGQESHGAPPGSYLVAGLLTAWPWSVLAPFAVIAAWKQRDVPAVRFCLAWLIPAWLVFELVPTKLPHYTMPLYPALALLIAALLTSDDFKARITGKAALAWRILWIVPALALGGGVVFAVRQYGTGVDAVTGIALLFTALTGLYAILALARVNPGTTLVTFAGLSALFAGVLTLGAIPRLTHMTISDRIVAAVAAYPKPIALAGYSEPSAVFLLGTDTVLTTVEGAAQHILNTPGAVAVVTKSDVAAIEDIAGDRTIDVLESVGGYNYSRGRWIRLAVITVGAPKEAPAAEPVDSPEPQ